jgi:hypothetical protein
MSGIFSQSYRIKAGLVFMSRRRPCLHVCLLCNNLWVDVLGRSGIKADVKVLGQIENKSNIEKNAYTIHMC